MRVGFDAHMVGAGETGNETYALGLLHGLDTLGFAVDAYTTRPLRAAVHRMHRIAPEASIARIPLSIPVAGMRDRLDLYHATYVLPLFMSCPQVVTVHDVSFALYPQWFSSRVRLMLRTQVARSMRQASHVIAISERTKSDIVKLFRIDPSRISVTPLAARPSLIAHTDWAPRMRDPYFLYVGNVQPRKNVEVLVRALSLLRERGMKARLVVAGKEDASAREIRALAQELGVEHLVEWRGYVSDDALRRLFSEAVALVHPAWYEGFGLTPLEAMARGTPVISSDGGALPEVVGHAAALVSPADTRGWADAMARVLDDRDYRDRLSAAGRTRALSFSWTACARATVDVYRRVLETSPGLLPAPDPMA